MDEDNTSETVYNQISRESTDVSDLAERHQRLSVPFSLYFHRLLPDISAATAPRPSLCLVDFEHTVFLF